MSSADKASNSLGCMNPVDGLVKPREQFIHGDQGFPVSVCLTVPFFPPNF